MRAFMISIILFLVLSAGLLWVQPHTWFYHGMACTGGIGGGCDRSTATGGIFGWMGNE